MGTGESIYLSFGRVEEADLGGLIGDAVGNFTRAIIPIEASIRVHCQFIIYIGKEGGAAMHRSCGNLGLVTGR